MLRLSAAAKITLCLHLIGIVARKHLFPGLPTLSLQTKSLFGQPWLWMSLCSEEGR